MAVRARQKMTVPITKPTLGDEESRAPIEVIRSGWVTQGPKVAEFERRVAAYVGARHGVATTSATTALHAALLVLGIGPGDEVIVPSLSFIASANSAAYTGADVVFCEVDRRTFNIDPADAERRITARTKAILPVDQIGLSCDIDAVVEIAKRHRLQVVEDAAPAIGATYKGRRVGAGPHQTIFSFHPRKLITTGEGGMVMTGDDGVAARLRRLRHHGMSVSDLERHQADRVVHEEYGEIGYNYRLSDIHAAIGIAQMDRLDAILAAIRERAERYNAELPGIRGVGIPWGPPYARHTYQTYMITLTDTARLDRDTLMARLLERGVATRHGIMASHLEPAYTSRQGTASLPVTEELARTTMIIPLYATMTGEEQSYVIDALREELGPA